jgi:hypothetical protein
MAQKGAWQKMFLNGVGFRTIYYGSQACIMFYLLEEFKLFLKVENMDD